MQDQPILLHRGGEVDKLDQVRWENDLETTRTFLLLYQTGYLEDLEEQEEQVPVDQAREEDKGKLQILPRARQSILSGCSC